MKTSQIGMEFSWRRTVRKTKYKDVIAVMDVEMPAPVSRYFVLSKGDKGVAAAPQATTKVTNVDFAAKAHKFQSFAVNVTSLMEDLGRPPTLPAPQTERWALSLRNITYIRWTLAHLSPRLDGSLIFVM